MAEQSTTPIAAQPRKIEVVERPGSGNTPTSRAGTATGSATNRKPVEKNYLKRYVAQSFMTEKERRQRDAHPFKDRNPFTFRQFCHENLCQSIPEKTPIRERRPAEQQAAIVEEPKDERPTTQRIKDAFKKGMDEPKGTAVAEPENVEGPEPLDAK